MVARYVLALAGRGPRAHSASAGGSHPLASHTPASPSSGACLVCGLRRDKSADRLGDAAGMVIPDCPTDCAFVRKAESLIRFSGVQDTFDQRLGTAAANQRVTTLPLTTSYHLPPHRLRGFLPPSGASRAAGGVQCLNAFPLTASHPVVRRQPSRRRVAAARI
jgi:hypothetical protein